MGVKFHIVIPALNRNPETGSPAIILMIPLQSSQAEIISVILYYLKLTAAVCNHHEISWIAKMPFTIFITQNTNK